jgi:isoquinoline 1-oxidoreductase beta subunit
MRRRTLLLTGLGGAALLVGWGVMPPRSRIGYASLLDGTVGEVALNGWIKIAPDGAVLLAMNRSEMGQGVHTALSMLVAEELDVPLPRVGLVPAGHDAIYGNVAMFVGSLPLHPRDQEPGHQTQLAKGAGWITAKLARELGINATGGSSTVADAWEPLRLAAATARAQLLGAASLRWKLPLEDLSVRDGVISHASGLSGHYGEFAQQAAATPPGDVTLKRRADWKLIGKPAQRIDLAAKMDGSARFGLDVREPDQVYAVVAHPPALGGAPGTVDVDAVLARPGVERVVRLPSYGGSAPALAVVARSTWHARQAVLAMNATWEAPPALSLDSRRIADDLEQQARRAADGQGGFAFHRRGDVRAAFAGASRRLESVYRAPYLAHAAMEPINCTARVKDGRVDVWVPTQVPGMARAMAARVASVPADAVSVHVTYLGGGFGRRLEVDVVGQAVRIALETGGRPVQLVWPREEDIMHDFYRPAGAAVLRAALDAQGQPQGLLVASAGDAITPRWMERGLPQLAGPIDAPDKTTSEGLFDIPYGIAHQRIAHVATRSGVPVGFWRSVGHSHNAFFSEGFIDELAYEAQADPVAFRLNLLLDAPRHAAVLRLAAEKAGWGTRIAAGTARGVALHESFGSVVAQIAEVTLAGRTPRVKRVVCAVDCGTVVNPGIVAQQMESAIVFGLSAALWGRIDIQQGIVRQNNFERDLASPNLRVLRMAEMPIIETHIVPSTRAPSGVGEPGTPPIAPAVANALFVLTGTRLRELPLKIPGAPSGV